MIRRSGMAGKGDRDRVTNRKAYESCPLWENLKKKKEVKNDKGIRPVRPAAVVAGKDDRNDVCAD
jgi:hypothetical protein